MYNKVQKEAFIEYHLLISECKDKEKYKQSLINFFNRLGTIEEQFGKDFSMMLPSEGKQLLSKFLIGSKNYQNSDKSHLNSYLDWSIKNNLSISLNNWLIALTLNMIDTSNAYENRMVKDEQDLESCLDHVLVSIDGMDTIDDMYRCYLHLLHAGLTKEEAFELKKDNIDFKTKKIIIRGKIIAVSDYLLRLVKHTLNIDEVNQRKGDGYARMPIVRCHEYVLENTVSLAEKADRKTDYRNKMKSNYNSAVSKRLSKCGRDINQTNIILSGIFSRMYKEEVETGQLNCGEYLQFKKNNIKTIESPKIVMNNCKYEYKIWKQSFNL